uniref:Uncharacterized protein n=1 Tax=Arundo donax TaxID=35708 RepID=A0A0A9HJH6_ARUDO
MLRVVNELAFISLCRNCHQWLIHGGSVPE